MTAHLSPEHVPGRVVPGSRARPATFVRAYTSTRRGVRQALSIWQADIRTERERRAFLAMSDHLLGDIGDIGVSRFELLERSAREIRR